MQQERSGSITLVLGGVRSGKSRLAQRIAEASERVTFVATAERRDDAEMIAKIDRHRADRPSAWKTIEEPLELARVIREVDGACQVLLIDCLTLFAANLLEACGDDAGQIEARIEEFVTALRSASCAVVLVSNEVGSGVVPAYAAGRQFRDLVGELNQRVAAVADTVVLMVA